VSGGHEETGATKVKDNQKKKKNTQKKKKKRKPTEFLGGERKRDGYNKGSRSLQKGINGRKREVAWKWGG